jgi:hypothetical protein
MTRSAVQDDSAGRPCLEEFARKGLTGRPGCGLPDISRRKNKITPRFLPEGDFEGCQPMQSAGRDYRLDRGVTPSVASPVLFALIRPSEGL